MKDLTFLLGIFCCLLSASVVAQKPTEDVLYLKNGWILRGKLLSEPTADSVKIQTQEGNVFVFAKTEIQEVKQESAWKPTTIHYKKRGYVHYTELGVMASKTNVNELGTTTSAFTFHTINGYKFQQFLYTGIGAGVDLYASQTFIPVFASIRGDFSRKGSLIPYYYLDGGWGFNGTTNAPETKQLGGIYVAAGAGLKILFTGNAGFLLSVGYYLQQTAIETQAAGTTTRRNLDYNRIAIRAGFSF